MNTTRPRAARIIAQQRLGDGDLADHVDLELAAVVVERQRLDRALDGDPGVVDQPREPPAGRLARRGRRRPRSCRASVTSMISGSSALGASARSDSPSSGLRTPAKTSKPLAVERSAQARPIPVEAPVTTTAPRSGSRPPRPLELDRIVGAEDADLVAVLAGEAVEALLVVRAAPSGRRPSRSGNRAGRAGSAGGSLHLAAVEVGVAAVQEPAVAVADRDPGVAARVADERDQQDLRARRRGARGCSRSPSSASPSDLVGDPLRAVREMALRIAGASRSDGFSAASFSGAKTWTSGRGSRGARRRGRGRGGCRRSGGRRRGRGRGSRICCDRGLAGVGLGAEGGRERNPEPPVGVGGVVGAEAGVDQDQRVAGLDQQAVADHVGAVKPPSPETSLPP